MCGLLDVSLQTGTVAMADPRPDTSAFKAYDIRGVVGENIDANLVECVTRAAAQADGLEYCELEGVRYDCGDKLGYLEAIVHSALENSEFGPNFEAFLRQMSQQREFAAE